VTGITRPESHLRPSNDPASTAPLIGARLWGKPLVTTPTEREARAAQPAKRAARAWLEPLHIHVLVRQPEPALDRHITPCSGARGGIRTHTLPTGAGGFKTARERPACRLECIWPGQGHRRVRRDRARPGRPAWYPRVLCTLRAPRAGAFALASPQGAVYPLASRRPQSWQDGNSPVRVNTGDPMRPSPPPPRVPRGVGGIRDGMTVSRSRCPVGHTQAVVGVRVGGASRTLTPHTESGWIPLSLAA
jgi:hypothetical protein